MTNDYTISTSLPDDAETFEFDYTEPVFGITVTYRLTRRAIEVLRAGDSIHFDHIIHGHKPKDEADKDDQA